jgi:hypothetical protein
MSTATNTNATYFSNYPIAPDGVVRTDAPVKKHPLASGSAAGAAVTAAVAVGGADKNTDGVGTRSDRKIV